MNISELVTLVTNYDGLVFHACKKNRENNFIVLSPDITGEIELELKRIVLENLNKFNELSQEEYNHVGQIADTLSLVNYNYSEGISNLIAATSIPTQGEIDPLEIDFFIYEFKKGEDTAYFVRRQNKTKSIRKGFFAQFYNGSYSKVDDNTLIAIDNKIDFIIFNDEVLISYHRSFERIFDLNSKFIENANLVLSNQYLSDGIVNFEELKKDALNNMSFVRRLARLDQSNTSSLFIDRIDKTEQVISRFNLDIRVEERKLVYSNKSQLGDFINFMQDAYYLTMIGEGEGIDERR